MSQSAPFSLAVDHLCVGLHVHLDLGWMDHPFARSSFRIANEEQLHTLRGLGLERVRVSLQHSDARAVETVQALTTGTLARPDGAAASEPPAAAVAQPVETPEQAARRARRAALEAEQASAAQAERQYADAGRVLKRVFEMAPARPQDARLQCEDQLNQLLDKLLDAGELAIRLLGEASGDRACQHGLNVAVLSLLLGQQLGLAKPDMFELGLGALLHDVGKLDLPERLRWLDPHAAAAAPTHERKFYEDHVPRGVAIGRAMALSPGALLVLGQHHELADGTGFPQGLGADKTSIPARVVALVNRYDNLCNPGLAGAAARTPHEALALLYGQWRGRFDATVFAAFIRMLGVYPPGSLVQLSDERHGLVIACNAARPLKPRVLVYEPKQAREDALPIELEAEPALGIRRSLKAEQLPRAALDWLSPRPRICYFFERARNAQGDPC